MRRRNLRPHKNALPCYQAAIINCSETRLFIKNQQKIKQNENFQRGYMQFLNLACSAALKKADPIVDMPAADFWAKATKRVKISRNTTQRCLLWDPLFLLRLYQDKHAKLRRPKSALAFSQKINKKSTKNQRR